MPNPLTDELTPEAKAWLAAKFAELGLWHPPLRVAGIDVPRATQRLIGGR